MKRIGSIVFLLLIWAIVGLTPAWAASYYIVNSRATCLSGNTAIKGYCGFPTQNITDYMNWAEYIPTMGGIYAFPIENITLTVNKKKQTQIFNIVDYINAHPTLKSKVKTEAYYLWLKSTVNPQVPTGNP